jgi:hypothetical protein
MNKRRILICAIPLLLSGCASFSSFQWSSLAPWNWFGSDLSVTEQGLGTLTASTPLTSERISAAIGSGYHLREGMKMQSGEVVRYFEALKDSKVMLVISGDKGALARIVVTDPSITSDTGVEIGSPFSKIFDKAQGHCLAGTGDERGNVDCQAPGSQHIHYIFSGEWQGPEGLIPPDETLRNWTVSQIVWAR